MLWPLLFFFVAFYGDLYHELYKGFFIREAKRKKTLLFKGISGESVQSRKEKRVFFWGKEKFCGKTAKCCSKVNSCFKFLLASPSAMP